MPAEVCSWWTEGVAKERHAKRDLWSEGETSPSFTNHVNPGRSGSLERPRLHYFPSTNGSNIGYGESLYRNGGAFAGHELHLRDTPIVIQVRDNPDIAGNNTAGCNVSRDYDRVQFVYHCVSTQAFLRSYPQRENTRALFRPRG